MRATLLLLGLLAVAGGEIWWLSGPGEESASAERGTPHGETTPAPPTLAGRFVAPQSDSDELLNGSADGAPSSVPTSPAPSASPARGVVLDENGRPIEGAGVYILVGPRDLAHAVPIAETTTDAMGRFEIPAAAGGAFRSRLAAVARGYLAASIDCIGLDAADLMFRLAPDTKHGRLEIVLTRPDGTPATDARAWIVPAPRERAGRTDDPPDDGYGLTRLLRARLEALNNEPDVEVGQGCFGLGGLTPDQDGRILVPACVPGAHRVMAAERLLSHGEPAAPGDSLMLSAYFTRDEAVGAETSAAATIEVEPPPRITRVRVTLRRARTVEGCVVVDVNPEWGCGRTHFRHKVRVEGLLSSLAGVESGRWESLNETHRLTGRFRLDGVPREACRLHVSTEWTGAWSPPDSVIDLAAATDGAETRSEEIVIHVSDARLLHGHVTWSDGSPYLGEADLAIEGYAGTASEILVGTIQCNPGPSATWFRALLDRPLGGSETAVLTLAPDPHRRFRIPIQPWDPGPGRPLEQDLAIPAPPPAAPAPSDAKATAEPAMGGK